MSRLESITSIAMAGALVQTYESKIYQIDDIHVNTANINKLLVQLEIAVDKALFLWERLDSKYYPRIDNKIQKMKEISVLGKPDYIITFIDFVIAILENLLEYIRVQKYCAVKIIIEILMLLREELKTDDLDEYQCSLDAVVCSQQWKGIII